MVVGFGVVLTWHNNRIIQSSNTDLGTSAFGNTFGAVAEILGK